MWISILGTLGVMVALPYVVAWLMMSGLFLPLLGLAILIPMVNTVREPSSGLSAYEIDREQKARAIEDLGRMYGMSVEVSKVYPVCGQPHY